MPDEIIPALSKSTDATKGKIRFVGGVRRSKEEVVLLWNNKVHGKGVTFPTPDAFSIVKGRGYPKIMTSYSVSSKEWKVFEWEISFEVYSKWSHPGYIRAPYHKDFATNVERLGGAGELGGNSWSIGLFLGSTATNPYHKNAALRNLPCAALKANDKIVFR